MVEEVKPHLKDFFLFLLFIIAGIIGIIFLFSKDLSPKTNIFHNEATGSAQNKKTPPPMTIDSKKVYKGQITTNKGLFTIELFAKETPVTVNNFVALAKDGFYNNTVFHRIIKDFMIQGGDPKGDGTGGPGYTLADEKITRDYKRGIVAMANSGPNTNGSQFFIVHEDNNLPKNYVVFGMVTEGLNVLDNIAETPVVDNVMGEVSKPTKKVEIKSIAVSEQ